MVVAPGRMIDSFLSIPDAESLPLYRMVLKLACVCGIACLYAKVLLYIFIWVLAFLFLLSIVHSRLSTRSVLLSESELVFM